MRFQSSMIVASALMAVLLTAPGPASAQSKPTFKPFGFRGRLDNLTMTDGACPGFTCVAGANCWCFSASGDRLNIRGIGQSDMTFNFNVNMNSGVPTGVGGTCFAGEGNGLIIPKGNSANLIRLAFGGFNLCRTQEDILIAKMAVALENGEGFFKAIEGIGDLAALISEIEGHIDMEIGGNFSLIRRPPPPP